MHTVQRSFNFSEVVIIIARWYNRLHANDFEKTCSYNVQGTTMTPCHFSFNKNVQTYNSGLGCVALNSLCSTVEVCTVMQINYG